MGDNFDAASFVQFDLNSGQVRTGDQRVSLVPPEVLTSLNPGKALDESSRNWGANHGQKLGTYLSNNADAGVDALADHLAGTIAALGLGRLSVEIRGDALAFRAESLGGAGPESLLSGFLAGYLRAIGSEAFEVIHMGADGQDQVYWAGNPNAARQMRQWKDQGIAPVEAVERMAKGAIR